MRTNRIGRMLAFCFALLIAVSAVQCSVVSASAAALPGDTWTEGSITATLDTKEQEAENVTVNAYKLVSVHTAQLDGTNPAVFQPSMPEYTWESGIADWVRDNYSAYISDTGDNSVQEVFSTGNEDRSKDISAAVAANFYAEIEAGIMGGTIHLSPVPLTVSGKTASVSGLTMGVYLVTATGGTAVYRPTVAMITPEESNGSWTIAENAQVGLKSSPVSLKKTITAVNGSAGTTAVSSDGKRAVAGIGDTVSYKLEVDVPEYPSQSVSRIFTITDTMPNGLTLKTDGIKVADQAGNEITIPTGLITATERMLTINLDNSDLITGKTKLVVTYDAQLNARATIGTEGNVNTAELTYTNNPYVTVPADTDFAAKARAVSGSDNTKNTKTFMDIATVYTFGIEVAKVAKGTKTGLQGAVFELKLKDTTQKIGFTGFGGTYTKAADGTAALTTGTDGKLTLKGLAPGTYKLKETKAPAGYVLSAGETEITIADTDFNGIPDSKEQPTTDTTTTQTTTTQTTEKDKDNGLVSITVENTKGFTLPRTGGIGTVLFSMIGIVLMGSGVLLVAVFLRKRFGKSR